MPADAQGTAKPAPPICSKTPSAAFELPLAPSHDWSPDPCATGRRRSATAASGPPPGSPAALAASTASDNTSVRTLPFAGLDQRTPEDGSSPAAVDPRADGGCRALEQRAAAACRRARRRGAGLGKASAACAASSAPRSSAVPSSHAVAVGLLEVVAEDLVELDQVGAALLEPVGEALVQLGARRLRQRVVGGVADQQVAEAEGVLARELRRSGRTSSLRTSAVSRGADLRLVGASAWTAPRWKTSPSTAPRSSTRRSAGSSWSRRAASSAWIVGGTVDVAVARLLDQRDHLLDEQRVALGGLAIRVAQRRASRLAEARIISVRLVGAERLEQHGGRVQLAAAQPGRRSSSSGRAMQSSRIGASRREVGDVLDQVEERLLAQWMSSKTHDERPLGAACLEQLAEGPGDLLGRGRRLARRRGATRIALRRGRVRARSHGELLERPRRPASR